MALSEVAPMVILVVTAAVGGVTLGAAGFWLAVGRLDRAADRR